ncbi:MAG: hypothetical protein AAF570_27860, partial [Bacteroidota bacterium]
WKQLIFTEANFQRDDFGKSYTIHLGIEDSGYAGMWLEKDDNTLLWYDDNKYRIMDLEKARVVLECDMSELEEIGSALRVDEGKSIFLQCTETNTFGVWELGTEKAHWKKTPKYASNINLVPARKLVGYQTETQLIFLSLDSGEMIATVNLIEEPLNWAFGNANEILLSMPDSSFRLLDLADVLPNT